MLQKQCPQFSIFIINSLISTIILLFLNRGDKLNIIVNSFFSLCISIYLLIGTGYCKWPSQWLTWGLVVVSILYTITTLIVVVELNEEDKVINFVTTNKSSHCNSTAKGIKEDMKANNGLSPWKCCNDCNEPDTDTHDENDVPDY
ncbi:membrane hypothetical protein [Gammaproteobacteria bacterium]